MATLVRDYTIERGIPFARQITITEGATPLDLSSVTIQADIRLSQFPEDIRPWPSGTGPLITSFDIPISDPPANGIFKIGLTLDKTLLLLRGAYDYDVVLTMSDATKRRILKGILTAVEITTHGE